MAFESSRSSAVGSILRSQIGICFVESSLFFSSIECLVLRHSDCSCPSQSGRTSSAVRVQVSLYPLEGYQRVPIPDYETIMLPLLNVLSDGGVHDVGDVR